MSKTKIPSRIFLVGPMGAGKTTIGSKLAENLGKQFFDSDQEIEQKTGASIPLIFELEGESGFRKRESQIIESLTQMNNIVLATGGGAVISEHNRALLTRSGFVIYLQAPLEQLIKRTAKDKNRPLLQSDNPEQVLSNLLKQREPFYKEVADLTFETHHKNLRDIITEITQVLEKQ